MFFLSSSDIFIKIWRGELVTRNYVLYIIAIVIGVTITGCKEKDVTWEEIDIPYARVTLERVVERNYSPDIQKLAKETLAELNNNVVNSYPTLVWAFLSSTYSEPKLALLCYDEDRDILGFHLREKHEEPNGTIVTIDENYPVFVSALKPSTLNDCRAIKVQLRDEKQRKDEWAWLQYENQVLYPLLDKYAIKGNILEPDTTIKIPDESPPIYISVPDPNHVHVEISVYDKAGNESDWIELKSKLIQEPEVDSQR